MESVSFDLVDYVNEQVLAEWVDSDSCETRTLGSLSAINRQDAGLAFRVGLDASLEQAFMRFSMDVSVRVSGRPRRRQLLLVLPLHVLSYKTPALEYDVLRISDIGESAPAVHDAGFSDSGFVLRARFDLQEPGYVLMPKSNAKALRPSTSTAASHLASIKSLSQALSFTLYIKPSDYAQQGIRMIYEQLRNDTLKQYPLHWDAMYGDHGAQPVEWQQCELGGKGKAAELADDGEDVEPPPPYVSERRDLAPRTPSPPSFEFPPSPACIPPFLLSPTQCSSQMASPEVLVERSVSYYSSPREALSATEDMSTHVGSDVYTIPATPDCLPEIRILLEAQAAAREREKEQIEHARHTSSPPETCRKRRASTSPAASPGTSGKETKRMHTAAEDEDPQCGMDFLASAASALLSLHHAPTPPSFPASPSLSFNITPAPAAAPYAALQSKLFLRQPDPPITAIPPPPSPPPPPPAALAPPLPPSPSPPHTTPNPNPNPTTMATTTSSSLPAFLAPALALNPRLYTHPRLSPLLLSCGAAFRAGDCPRFARLRARLAAEFFWDPLGTVADAGRTRSEAVEWYVCDMEGLVGWVGEVDGVWGELVGLGRAARGEVRAGSWGEGGDGGGGGEAYRWAKGVVIAAAVGVGGGCG
ncbi:uncharacterized protein BKCO1_2500021 [Diplodia corticola]|uniref:Uncharacterized protein n=1 Tax=Diplodia corticola TaxID=236234 RepID=A0A1J9R0L2_9PEZI|nr:uncharacterized protein BKCO1_2500021 [Diplodia corticola]OJD34137.1 hypothetical protein BKCO1_2500021 [Diplodia corticola]